MEGIVYKYTNKINGKVYIGQTLHPKQRKENHKCALTNGLFHKAIRKYGWDNFEYEVLCVVKKPDYREVKELLNRVEVLFISHYDSFNNGYNMTIGGDQVMKSRKHTEETRVKISEIKKGTPAWNKGKHMSPETRAKMSKANQNKVFSDETRQKLRDNAIITKVLIDGVIYPSLIKASSLLDLNYTTLVNYLHRGKTRYKGHSISYVKSSI